MAIWGNDFFVGIGGLGMIIAAVLYFTGSGPFQPCVTNGFGAQFCGEEAKTYCREVSDPLVGRTAACNEILEENREIGAGGASYEYSTGYE